MASEIVQTAMRWTAGTRDVDSLASSTYSDYYCLPHLYYVEDIQLYRPGGLHPVHLGDRFDNGRYRAIHKLGYGGSLTVWLARDEYQHRYVSLKIIAAKASKDCNDLKFLFYLM